MSRFTKKISILFIFSLIFTVLPLNLQEADASGNFVFVKTPNNPTVYMIQNSKKYTIRNEAIFRSYGMDWSDVHIISEEYLMKFPTARLLRSSAGPSVYYLDYQLNKKHIQPTEQIFRLYGNRFEDVIIISEFDLTSWEDTTLVKTSNDTAVYYLEANQKRLIPTEQDFLSLGFSWEDIATIAPFDLAYYQEGERLTASDTNKVRVVQEPAKAGLLITKEDHEVKQAFSAFTRDNLYMRMALSSEAQPVTVRSVEFKQAGHVLGRGSYIYIQEKGKKEAIQHATTLEGEYARIHFLNNELTLPPYTKKVFDISVSIGGISQSKIAHSLSVSDVESTGETKPFNVRSPFYNIIFDQNLITKVGVDIDKIIRDTNQLVVSNTSQNITQFTFQVMNEEEDVYLKRLIIENEGNIPLDQLKDLRVNISNSGSSNTKTTQAKRGRGNREVPFYSKNRTYREIHSPTEQKKSTTTPSNISTGMNKTVIEPNRIIIYLEDTPGKISRNQELKVIVSASLSGRQEGEILNLMIADPSDIMLVGAESQQFIVAFARGLNDRSFPIGDRIEAPFNVITTGYGQSALAVATGSAKGTLAAGAKNVSIAQITIKNGREDAVLERAEVKIESPGQTALTSTLRVVYGGKVVASGNASEYMNRWNAIRFPEPVSIKQNQTVTLSLEIDVPFGALATDSYQLSFRNPELRTVTTKFPYVIYQEVTANKLTVIPFVVSIRANPDAANIKMSSGGKNQVIGSFYFKNDSGASVTIRKIELARNSGDANLRPDAGFIGMRVSGSNDTLFFAGNSLPYMFDVNITVSAGREQKIDIVMDTETFASGTLGLQLIGLRLMGGNSDDVIVIDGNGLTTGFATFTPRQ